MNFAACMSRFVPVLFAFAILQPMQAAAQAYPSKTVRVIVPYAPGGSVDLMGRLVAQALQQGLGQSAVVDNRAGAGGAIGADAVAKSAPDGYTLMVCAVGAMTVNVHFQKLPYDPIKDFAPISALASSPLLLAVNSSVPVKNVSELLAYVKSQPKGVLFSSTGPGSLSLLAGEYLKMMTGANLQVVTYNGGAPAAAAIATGEVPFGITDSAPILAHVAAGRARVLALTEPQRVPSKPDIPTVAESGLPGYDVSSWVAFFAPAGTSNEIVNRLYAEVERMFKIAEYRDRSMKAGLDPIPAGPAALAKLVRTDFEKWRTVIAKAGLKAQ
jgi:tripartite-type tricarboxylate transporter receptor subunit TctC